VVVDVDSSVLVAAGSGAGVVKLVVVEVVSFSLLQPANNANVIKPVAISALFFIIEFSFLKFYLGYLPNKFKPTINANTEMAFISNKTIFIWLGRIITIQRL
jgi:hypothetical protein